MSFSNIQSLLIGSSIDLLELKKYYTWIENQSFILSSINQKTLKKITKTKKNYDKFFYLSSIDPSNHKIIYQQYKSLKLNNEILAKYDDFEIHNNKPIAESIQINITTNNEMKFFEPMYGKFIKLSKEERDSIWYVNF